MNNNFINVLNKFYSLYGACGGVNLAEAPEEKPDSPTFGTLEPKSFPFFSILAGFIYMDFFMSFHIEFYGHCLASRARLSS